MKISDFCSITKIIAYSGDFFFSITQALDSEFQFENMKVHLGEMCMCMFVPV